MRRASIAIALAATVACSRKVTIDMPKVNIPSDDAGGLVVDLGNLHLNSATGHVESTGATGKWTLERATCHSGDDDGFFGVLIESKADSNVFLKLVKDPIKGWSLGASIPDSCKGDTCTVHYFDPASCSTFDIGLKAYTFRGRSSSGTHQFDGEISFDCTEGKGHVSGKLNVEKCSR